MTAEPESDLDCCVLCTSPERMSQITKDFSQCCQAVNICSQEIRLYVLKQIKIQVILENN